MDLRINDRYRLASKIGSGSFGEIFHGADTVTKQAVAIKLEPLKSRHPQLLYESRIYSQLQGGEGVPELQCVGRGARGGGRRGGPDD